MARREVGKVTIKNILGILVNCKEEILRVILVTKEKAFGRNMEALMLK